MLLSHLPTEGLILRNNLSFNSQNFEVDLDTTGALAQVGQNSESLSKIDRFIAISGISKLNATRFIQFPDNKASEETDQISHLSEFTIDPEIYGDIEDETFRSKDQHNLEHLKTPSDSNQICNNEYQENNDSPIKGALEDKENCQQEKTEEINWLDIDSEDIEDLPEEPNIQGQTNQEANIDNENLPQMNEEETVNSNNQAEIEENPNSTDVSKLVL